MYDAHNVESAYTSAAVHSWEFRMFSGKLNDSCTMNWKCYCVMVMTMTSCKYRYNNSFIATFVCVCISLHYADNGNIGRKCAICNTVICGCHTQQSIRYRYR